MMNKVTFQTHLLMLFTLLTTGLSAQHWQDTLAMQYDSLQPYVHTHILYERYWLAPYADSSYTANPVFYSGNNAAQPCSYSTFYRLAMITGQGLLVMLAGYLETSTGNVPMAWSIVFYLLAALFLASDEADFVSGVGFNVDGGAIVNF